MKTTLVAFVIALVSISTGFSKEVERDENPSLVDLVLANETSETQLLKNEDQGNDVVLFSVTTTNGKVRATYEVSLDPYEAEKLAGVLNTGSSLTQIEIGYCDEEAGGRAISWMRVNGESLSTAKSPKVSTKDYCFAEPPAVLGQEPNCTDNRESSPSTKSEENSVFGTSGNKLPADATCTVRPRNLSAVDPTAVGVCPIGTIGTGAAANVNKLEGVLRPGQKCVKP